MKKALRMTVTGLLAMAGLLLIMGAAGSVDYALEIGREVPTVWTTIGRAAGAVVCFLASYVIWAGGDR